uniref:G-protein coupled receptor GRL101-like n=1 Tax=Ciona intestinalis TaxID=7719 RepID=UPI000EF50062|nr:G-protein coupled receptor GRL101-like [Ciona intestinalis]|eukprot:XP_026693920.1 G-protein coupled receptor GRL101-like [Ciona intestinalis]
MRFLWMLLLFLVESNASELEREDFSFLTRTRRKQVPAQCGVTSFDEKNCTCPSWAYECGCRGEGRGCDVGNTTCVPHHQLCDGVKQCPYGSDEVGCSCATTQVRCGCVFGKSGCRNDTICIDKIGLISGVSKCSDGSDNPCEIGFQRMHVHCQLKYFQCEDEIMTHRILMYRSSRDIGKCWPIQTHQSSNKTVEKWRCIKDMSLSHGREVCHSIINKTESLISCAFNNRLYMGSYLCSPFANQCVFGKYIVPKKSYKYGFKCTARSSYACGGGAIYIPQSNLEDSDVNCADKSDLCFVDGKMKCFRCLDGQLLISPKQICDGIFDCFDLSDECLCGDQQACSSVMASKRNCTEGQVFTNNSGCVNPQVIFEKNSNFSLSIEASRRFVKMRIYEEVEEYKCHKFNAMSGTKCDGYLDCPYGDDECGCESELGSCKHVKKCFFGNYKYRVCDGVVSAIVHYKSQIEKLRRAQRGGDTRFDNFIGLCTEGFDEANCTNRHLCIEGASISISSSRVCDGVVDCDDGSDEIESLCRGSRFYCLNKDPISVPRTTVEDGIKDCSDGSDECPVNTTKSTIFSSQFEMIANPILSAIFWGMGVVSIFGNCLVIVTTIKRQVKAKTPSSTARINAWFITNLAMSDLLMGVYLLSISIQGAIFSGRYCYHDMEWRSGTLCSLMGATAVLATEASVFMMTIMTTHRLVSVMRPFALRNVELQPFAIITTYRLGVGLCSCFHAIDKVAFRIFRSFCMVSEPVLQNG